VGFANKRIARTRSLPVLGIPRRGRGCNWGGRASPRAVKTCAIECCIFVLKQGRLWASRTNGSRGRDPSRRWNPAAWTRVQLGRARVPARREDVQSNSVFSFLSKGGRGFREQTDREDPTSPNDLEEKGHPEKGYVGQAAIPPGRWESRGAISDFPYSSPITPYQGLFRFVDSILMPRGRYGFTPKYLHQDREKDWCE
jgi:hypothetical protein